MALFCSALSVFLGSTMVLTTSPAFDFVGALDEVGVRDEVREGTWDGAWDVLGVGAGATGFVLGTGGRGFVDADEREGGGGAE